jgi:hypothetical protein
MCIFETCSKSKNCMHYAHCPHHPQITIQIHISIIIQNLIFFLKLTTCLTLVTKKLKIIFLIFNFNFF